MPGIDIRFINSGKTFVGRAIDWATNSLIDHVEIGARASYGDSAVTSWIGAHSQDGVQERPLDYCKDLTLEWRYNIPCTAAQWTLIIAAARADIGVKYNFLDIAGLLLHERRLNDAHAMICSHAVFTWMFAGGIQMLNVLPQFAQLVTPETLHLSPLLIGRSTLRFPDVKAQLASSETPPFEVRHAYGPAVWVQARRPGHPAASTPMPHAVGIAHAEEFFAIDDDGRTVLAQAFILDDGYKG